MALIGRWRLPSVAVNEDYDQRDIVSAEDYHCQQLICVLNFLLPSFAVGVGVVFLSVELRSDFEV